MISSRYHQSNGLIEIQVRTGGGGITQKYAKTGNDMLIVLQQHQCTLLDSNLSNPNENRFKRPIRTAPPSHHSTLMQHNQQVTNEQLQQRIDRMIRDHDRRAGPVLPALHAGQRVRILNKDTHQWSPGEIVAEQSHVRTLCKRQTGQGYAELDHTRESCKLRTSSTKLPTTHVDE